MKALLFGALWLGPGVVVALRASSRHPVERLLCLLFWPFFLFDTDEAPQPAAGPVPRGPLARLHRALGGDDAASSVVLELQQAVARLEERLQRMDAALGELGPEAGAALPEADPLADARARSTSLLQEARTTCKSELDAALAAVEETATRLVIARETGSSAEVRELLASLRGRLQAAEEVAAVDPDAPVRSLRQVG